LDGIEEALSGDGLLHPDPMVPDLIERIRMAASGAHSAPAVDRGKDPDSKPLGEILIEQYNIAPDDIEEALEQQAQYPPSPKLGELLVQSGKAKAQEVAQAVRSQCRNGGAGEPLRVDAARLEKLVDLIGELVITEAMVSDSPLIREVADTELERQISQMNKITRELQEMATSLRMVPIRGTFQKMARMVRDTAKKAGKQVEFSTAGEDTELDKTVVEKIGDPLMHMVRNAVDHGLEPNSEQRVQNGKPEKGHVRLRAYHKASNIYIEISDDGRGLDRDAILKKAIAAGIVNESARLTDKEVWDLIFEPGLSTAEKVTDVSGRGVGMDVVRRNIEALRGHVEVESEHGKGSIFRIRLPLTLSIIDGMVARIGNERFILPTLSIIMATRPNADELRTALQKGEMVRLRGNLVPVIRLDRSLGVADAEQEPENGILVLVEDEGRQAALLVDELLGQQQIVIKSLGRALGEVRGVAGGAVMPDGRAGLILDIEGITRSPRSTPSSTAAHN